MRLIDAENAKVIIQNTVEHLAEAGNGAMAGSLLFAVEVIDNAPTVDPVKHGKWIWDDNAIDWGIGAWMCSECHGRNRNILAKKEGDPNIWHGSKFCPNCGAKMDKE